MRRMMAGVSALAAAAQQAYAMGAPQGEGQGSPMNMIFIFAVFLIAMYFFMIRPEQRRRKEKEEMLRRVNVGDRIVTTGGIFGVVKQVKDDTIRLQIDDHARIELSKAAIGNVIERAGEPSAEA